MQFKFVIQAKSMRRPWDTSKGFDLSAPCGLLVPVGERGHVRKGCVMECRVNGEVVQKTEIAKMIWKVANASKWIIRISNNPAQIATIVPQCHAI